MCQIRGSMVITCASFIRTKKRNHLVIRNLFHSAWFRHLVDNLRKYFKLDKGYKGIQCCEKFTLQRYTLMLDITIFRSLIKKMIQSIFPSVIFIVNKSVHHMKNNAAYTIIMSLLWNDSAVVMTPDKFVLCHYLKITTIYGIAKTNRNWDIKRRFVCFCIFICIIIFILYGL